MNPLENWSQGDRFSAAHLNQALAAIRALDAQSGYVESPLGYRPLELFPGRVSWADPKGATSTLANEQYWVARAYIKSGLQNDPKSFSNDIQTGADEKPGAYVFNVTNLPEWNGSTHSLLIGQQVWVFAWFDYGNPSHKHYLMWHTQPMVKVLVTGGANPTYAVTIKDGVPNPNPAYGSSNSGTMENLPETAGITAPIPAGTFMMAKVLKALPGAITLEGDITCGLLAGYLGCASGVTGESWYYGEDFNQNHFLLGAINVAGRNHLSVLWRGFDIINEVYAGLLPTPGGAAGLNSEILHLRGPAIASNQITGAGAGFQRYAISWGAATDSSGSRSPCTAAATVETFLAGMLDIALPPTLTVYSCGTGPGSGLITPTEYDTVTSIQFLNGFTLSRTGAGVLKVSPNVNAPLKVDTTGSGGECGGLDIALAGDTTWTNYAVAGGIGVVSHIGPSVATANYTAVGVSVSGGTSITITPYTVDVDAKGHVVSTTPSGSPTTFTPTPYTPPTGVTTTRTVVSNVNYNTSTGVLKFTSAAWTLTNGVVTSIGADGDTTIDTAATGC